MQPTYHFKLQGVIKSMDKVPMGNTGKAKLQVVLGGGTAEYPKNWPVDFFGDDAKTLATSGMAVGEKITVQGYINSRDKEYNGRTIHNIFLTGKDVTRDDKMVAPEPPASEFSEPTGNIDNIPF